MRRTTERRLLLALLLSSIVPLLALGALAAMGISLMGRELQRLDTEILAQRAREEAATRASEAADRIASLLQGCQADMRVLALLPPRPDLYERFSRTHLAPIHIRANGRDTVVWPPLYSRITYRNREGWTVTGTPFGGGSISAPAGADASPAAPSLPPPEAVLRPVPGPDRGGVPELQGLELQTRLGEGAAVLTAVLDVRHLRAALAPRPGGKEGGAVLAVLFGPGGEPFVLAPGGAPPAGPAGLREAVRRALQGDPAVWASSGGRTGAVHPIPNSWASARPRPLGAVVALLPPPPSPPEAPILTLSGRFRLYVGVLTLFTALILGVAAVVVARRMSRPWVRLQEKARTLAPTVRDPEADEVEIISESFDRLAREVVDSAGRLRASEERLREFFEMSPDGIAVVDADGRLLHCNRALCQMLRRSPQEMASLQMQGAVVEPGTWSVIRTRLRERGRIRNYETVFRRSDGSEFPALLSLRRALAAGREQVEIIVRDISEIKEAQQRDREKTETLFRVYGELSQAHQALQRAYADVEEQVRHKTRELQEAYRALQAADRVKTEFLMQMSHELRTPLNCIIGYSEAMIDGLDGPVSEEQASSLRRISESGKRLLRLIENILDLSRLEAGRMEFAPTAVRIEEIAEGILHQARSLVEDRPVRLELALEGPLPPVWADPDRLSQVIFNLLGNAVKFTERGTVRVAARREGPDLVAVAVSDTGPGISPEQQARIFDKFVRTPGNRKDGAGLGLAICREIVERMGGTIRVRSTPGKGSTFEFTVLVAHGERQLALPMGLPGKDGPPVDGSGAGSV